MSLILTWPPVVAFHFQPYEWGAFEADMSRFARLINGTLEPLPALITNPTVKDMHLMMLNDVIAVDIETAPCDPARPWTGKDPTQAHLKTIAFGCSDWALSFLWDAHADLRREANSILADEKITKVFQNGHFFDVPILRRYGCVIR